MRKEIPVAIRKLIVRHAASGMSYSNIATLVQVNKNTVAKIVQRYYKEYRFKDAPRSGRPKIVTPHESRQIMRKIKLNPKVSAPKLTAEYCKETGKNCCEETIRRVIRKEGFNGRVARKKPFINETNRKRRLDFARQYVSKDEHFWSNVIFCDESKFNLFGSDGKVMVWRKPNDELKHGCVKTTVKHGGGNVMVWGCVSAHGTGELFFIDEIMKWPLYLHILKTNLLSSAAKMGIRRTFHFYQDNDRKHCAAAVKEWLLYNCPKVIKTPAQSPDLNPIENLWYVLDCRIREKPPSSKEQLRSKLKTEWANISAEYCSKLISTMPKRLRCVIDNKGYATKY